MAIRPSSSRDGFSIGPRRRSEEDWSIDALARSNQEQVMATLVDEKYYEVASSYAVIERVQSGKSILGCQRIVPCRASRLYQRASRLFSSRTPHRSAIRGLRPWAETRLIL